MMSNPAKSGNRLPVVICEPDSTDRSQWMDVLSDLVRREYPSLKLDAMPGEVQVLKRILETENGIMLVILAITGMTDSSVEECIRMFTSVMEKNRDSYVVLCVHNMAYLNVVLSRCMRPAGIMVVPFNEELMRSSLRSILQDYVALCGSEEDDSQYMVVNSGKTHQRIAYRDILYLEAQDKLLNINLERHVITVRSSLNALAEELPEGFIRCHRSYIVNRLYVERISLTDMTLYLTTQEKLPISRSYKDGLRTSLKAEGWI